MSLGKAKRDIAWWRINFGLAIFLVSFFATIFFGDRLPNTADVIGIIATIFSILSGVLIAVISILGDPSMLMDQSWRHSYVRAKEVQRKLHRNTDVFVLYIVLLAVIFGYSLMTEKDALYGAAQRVSFFLTVAAFLASLSLPFSLMAVQKQRLAAAIESMK